MRSTSPHNLLCNWKLDVWTPWNFSYSFSYRISCSPTHQNFWRSLSAWVLRTKPIMLLRRKAPKRLLRITIFHVSGEQKRKQFPLLILMNHRNPYAPSYRVLYELSEYRSVKVETRSFWLISWQSFSFIEILKLLTERGSGEREREIFQPIAFWEANDVLGELSAPSLPKLLAMKYYCNNELL